MQEVFADAVRHRIGLTYEAEAEQITPDAILKRIVETTPSPHADTPPSFAHKLPWRKFIRSPHPALSLRERDSSVMNSEQLRNSLSS